jgi:RNA polymerase sigma-70 factor (ECF subfamily)
VLSETVTGVDFDTFYRAECKSLVRFVMWLGCSDAGTAEDIAQTAFIRAFPAWETIQFLQAWLRKVAQNEYARYCRAAARETSLDAEPGQADRQAGTSAAMALEQQSDTRDLLAAIADLPPKQRQVMAWHWDGFSDAETAVALGDSTEAVRKNRNRAMKKLRRSLTQVREEGK